MRLQEMVQVEVLQYLNGKKCLVATEKGSLFVLNFDRSIPKGFEVIGLRKENLVSDLQSKKCRDKVAVPVLSVSLSSVKFQDSCQVGFTDAVQ